MNLWKDYWWAFGLHTKRLDVTINLKCWGIGFDYGYELKLLMAMIGPMYIYINHCKEPKFSE